MTFQKPKGTRDQYPEGRAVFNRIAEAMRNCAGSYAFREVESPAFEDLNLLTAKSGEEIKQQIFTLEKRGDEEFGLRFDLTVPFTRMFIEKQKILPKPVKWFSIGRMWRYERPQAGRLREFYQLSAEVFGSPKPEADAEIISLAIDCLKNLGLTKKDFVVRINNRVLLQDFIKSIGGKDIEAVFRAIDKKQKIPSEDFDNELKKAGLDDEQKKKIKEFIEVRDINKIEIESEGLDNLKKILSMLKNREDFIEVDLSTARGLAYYTGTVFEIFDRRGRFRSLAGGGRYDNMIKLFGGEPCPATGFAIGFATLRLLLEEKNLLPEPELGADYYIAPLGEKARETAGIIAEKFRKEGKSVETDLIGRSPSKQLDYANKTGAKSIIFIGDEEIKKGKARIKDMKTGDEKEIAIGDI
ncbi:MAG: histidine--tRNA ligase [Candidatus Woesearchaeota archaeon]